MKHELTLHYSVQNGGDGSAYPHFMESEKLTEWDQDNAYEDGWGECCNGSITVESDSPIVVKEKIQTVDGYFLDILDDYKPNPDKIKDFVDTFYEGVQPTFTVGEPEIKKMDAAYDYYPVLKDGVKIGRKFAKRNTTPESLEKAINGE